MSLKTVPVGGVHKMNGNIDGSGFWKKNARSVPGRPSPKKQPIIAKPAHTSTFDEFDSSVSDAWSIDDCCRLADVHIERDVAESAAATVLFNFQQRQKATPNVVEKTVESSRLVNDGLDESERIKVSKFASILSAPMLDLKGLRGLSWGGIPPGLRATTWRLLADYLPASQERRASVLKRKREDYWNFVQQYYNTEGHGDNHDIYHQIHIDIPRMSPEITLFQQEQVQQIFERILFIWAIRHPASGYVQGMNDLVTPFFVVFLCELLPDMDLNTVNIAAICDQELVNLEADTFWCLSKFLDGIQDNYIFAQLGIQKKVIQLKELIQTIDVPLHKHLQNHGVDYLQFSFRWINNLLTRELPLRCTVRLWDTYLAEADGLATFQLYVCAAFLLHWRKEILEASDFQGLMMLLQRVPCEKWNEAEVGVLLAEAYRLKFTYADAPNHIQGREIP